MKLNVIANLNRLDVKRLVHHFYKKCFYCEKPLSTHNRTVDHLIPSSKDGRFLLSNLVGCCQGCNNEKADRDVYEYIGSLHKGAERKKSLVRQVKHKLKEYRRVCLLIDKGK